MKKTLNKKLVINKTTITNLTNKEQVIIQGGAAGTVYGRTCDGIEAAGTVHGRTCELP